jgi:hypothetical protein
MQGIGTPARHQQGDEAVDRLNDSDAVGRRQWFVARLDRDAVFDWRRRDLARVNPLRYLGQAPCLKSEAFGSVVE